MALAVYMLLWSWFKFKIHSILNCFPVHLVERQFDYYSKSRLQSASSEDRKKTEELLPFLHFYWLECSFICTLCMYIWYSIVMECGVLLMWFELVIELKAEIQRIIKELGKNGNSKWLWIFFVGNVSFFIWLFFKMEFNYLSGNNKKIHQSIANETLFISLNCIDNEREEHVPLD